jgi:DNA-binding SARP family transcriptional activator
MFETQVADSACLYPEIEQGLACAATSHYADAATHLLRARALLAPSHTQIVALIDQFIDSHRHFWLAQQGLNEASHRLVATQAEQQACLAALQQIVAQSIASQPGGTLAPVALPSSPAELVGLPELAITCFGRFGVRRGGEPLALCANRNGQAILRYLAAQPQHSAPVYVLIELLWPHDDLEVARHKLHVAVSALRSSLNAGLPLAKGAGYLVCEGSLYQLNTAARIRVDVDEFVAACQAGRRAGGSVAIAHYEAACQLYGGPFLVEDLYADWTQIRREQLVQMYAEMCAALADDCLERRLYDAAIDWAGRTLHENRCDEAAYRRLMLAYAGAGRRAEALRQFQRCRRVLADEMGIAPAEETTALFEQVQRRELPQPARTLGG